MNDFDVQEGEIPIISGGSIVNWITPDPWAYKDLLSPEDLDTVLVGTNDSGHVVLIVWGGDEVFSGQEPTQLYYLPIDPTFAVDYPNGPFQAAQTLFDELYRLE